MNTVDDINVKTTQTHYQSKIDNGVSQKINSNAVDKTPEKDTVQVSSKGLSTAQKWGITLGAVVGLELAFAFSGNIKKAINNLIGSKSKIKNVMNEIAEQTKNNTQGVVEHSSKTEPVKLEMSEEAKKVYDGVSSRLRKKTDVSSSTIDNNLKPREKTGTWSKQDMQEYYSNLEEQSIKRQEETKKIIKGIEENAIQVSNAERNEEIGQIAYGMAPLERGLSHKSAEETFRFFHNTVALENRRYNSVYERAFNYVRGRNNFSHINKNLVNQTFMERYLSEYIERCGSFQKVDKIVEINGKPIKIIYEGIGHDITENGELLKKVFNPVSNKNELIYKENYADTNYESMFNSVRKGLRRETSQTNRQRALA